jgi:LysR family transcriptional regulator, regulator for bpeEF and oprC
MNAASCDLDTAPILVATTSGIAQIPAFVLKEALERGSLDLLLGDWFAEPAPLNVVYPQNRHLSVKIRVFVDWVAELFGEHDGIQLRSTLRNHA